MANIWVLVADSSGARIFEAENSDSPLSELLTLTHPESRMHEQELTSDLPGSQGALDGRHHGMDNKTAPKKNEAMVFAKEISKHLEKSHLSHAYNRLILIAPPAFLGLLRENMTPGATRTVILELDKNLSQQSPEEIRQHLPEKLKTT